MDNQNSDKAVNGSSLKDVTPFKLYPSKKVYNKIFLATLFYSFSFLLLILACTLGYSAFSKDLGKLPGNITLGALCLSFSIIFFILLIWYQYKRCERPYSIELYKWMLYLSAIPFVNAIVAYLWRRDEKKIFNTNCALKDKNFKPSHFMPATLTILFMLIIFIVLTAWIYYVSTGGVEYSYKDKEGIVHIEKCPVPGILDIFLNPIKGFTGYTSEIKQDFWKDQAANIPTPGLDKYQRPFKNGTASITIFLLSMNGMMVLVSRTKALEAGMGKLLIKMKGKEIILVPLLTFILSICGTVWGMCEQTMPLFVVVVPLLYAAGFDIMTGALVVIFGAGIGVAGSLINPTMISIACDAASHAIGQNISMTNGIVWRAIIYILFTIACCTVLTLYAIRVKKNPTKSLVYLSEQEFKTQFTFDKASIPEFTRQRKITLWIFSLSFLLLMIGFISWEKIIPGFTGITNLNNMMKEYFPFLSSANPIGDWEMVEGAFLFTISAFIVGFVNWRSEKDFIKVFVGGCAEFLGVAFTCTLARGLSITLTESGLHTALINGCSSASRNINPSLFIFLVFILLSFLSFFIPSTSGLGSASMPVLAPLAVNANVSVSGVITAFSHAEGIVNLFSPTSMVLPQLEASKITYDKFLKTTWPMLLLFTLISAVTLLVGPMLGNGLF